MKIDYLIDAGPLVGLLSDKDQWHKWSVGAIDSLGDVRLATTESALAEACHKLRPRRSAVLDLLSSVKEGIIVPAPILAENPARVRQLMEKYPGMDLADATLVVLSEQMPKARLLTVDRRDFSVYHRSDGTLVPSIMPPS